MSKYYFPVGRGSQNVNIKCRFMFRGISAHQYKFEDDEMGIYFTAYGKNRKIFLVYKKSRFNEPNVYQMELAQFGTRIRCIGWEAKGNNRGGVPRNKRGFPKRKSIVYPNFTVSHTDN